MSSRMCRGNKISLTLFGASSPDYHPCYIVITAPRIFAVLVNDIYKFSICAWSNL